MSGPIGTVRLYAKTNRPTLASDDRIPSDNPATGLGVTRFADLLAQFNGLYQQLTGRNASLGYAGVAADGFIDASILRGALVPEEVADDTAKNALTVVSNDIGRRLVRVTASGINYIAKAAGTGADKWQVYNTAPSATETVQGLLEIATEIEALAGADDARAITALKLRAALMAYVDPRTIGFIEREGLRFKGGYITGTTTTGPGTGPFTIFGAVRNEDTSVNNTTILLGSGLTVYSTNNANNLQIFSGAFGSVNFGAFPNRGMNVFMIWRGTDGVIRAEINGVDTGVTTSNAYDFASWSSIGGESGVQMLTGSISKLGIINYGLSAAERSALIMRGLVTLPEQRVGSVTNKLTGNNNTFTGGVGDWLAINGAAINAAGGKGVITGIADNFYAGVVCVTAPLVKGRKYRAVVTLSDSTGGNTGLVFGDSGAGTYGTALANATTSIEFTAVNNNVLAFFGTNNGTGVSIDNVELYDLGTLLELDSGQRNAGYMVRDISGNGHHVELPASGVEIIDPAAKGVLVYTRTSSGYVIGDRVVIPDGHVITDVFATGDGTASLGESPGTPANVCASATLTSTPQRLPVLVAVTSNQKLYEALGTATTATFTIHHAKRV